MNIKSFLYRRFSNLITCEFKTGPASKIALATKYDVASFNDVFCHPFYWQVFKHLKKEPEFIVDAGAHCGHFSILINICIKAKFIAKNHASYLCIEPNPKLIPILEKNLNDAGLGKFCEVCNGLLGDKKGHGVLYVNQKNYLTSSLFLSKGLHQYRIPYIDLYEKLQGRQIDILKMDIEGAEYQFALSNIDVFKNTRLLLLELHEAPDLQQEEFIANLRDIGLNVLDKPLKANGQLLFILGRDGDC